MIDGASIAELVTGWVNRIAGRLLEKYPDLWIQFGLHATSVKNEYEKLAEIDPRINITWEDAGSFPYAYDPANIKGLEETLDFTSKICSLRGAGEDFGIVMKGLRNLNWSKFEHQKGTYILGEAKESLVKAKALEASGFWRHIQANWVRNLDCVLKTIKTITEKERKRLSIVALVEDGLWEEHMWCPVALYAEALWNADEDPEEIIRKVSRTADAYFA
jgi:hypothetical protein